MTPGSPGLMGVLLIVIGLAFALLAVAIVLNRRDTEAESRGEPAETDQQDAEAAMQTSAGEASIPDETEAEAPEGPAAELPDEVAATDQPPPDEAEREQPGEPEAKREQPAEPEAEHEQAEADDAVETEQPIEGTAAARELLPIAELLREEVTGELILRLGDRFLRSPEQIENEADRRRLQYAAADLSGWFEATEPPSRQAKQPTADEGSAELDRPKAAAEGAEAPRPRDMIEAINAILDRKLAGEESASRAVRLVPDPTGGVRVLIGVKSYLLEEVPDEATKELIRQAVGEWEASQ